MTASVVDEPTAYDRALGEAIAAQERRVRDLEWRLEGAETAVAELLARTEKARRRQEDVRARLAVARTQLWQLRCPAAAVDLNGVLDDNMQRALAGVDDEQAAGR